MATSRDDLVFARLDESWRDLQRLAARGHQNLPRSRVGSLNSEEEIGGSENAMSFSRAKHTRFNEVASKYTI